MAQSTGADIRDYQNYGIYLHNKATGGIGTALAVDANHLDALHNKTCALAALDRFAEARACAEKVLTIKPDDGMAWGNLGAAWANLGIVQELYLGTLGDAMQSYRRYLATRPSDEQLVAGWIREIEWATGGTTAALDSNDGQGDRRS